MKWAWVVKATGQNSRTHNACWNTNEQFGQNLVKVQFMVI